NVSFYNQSPDGGSVFPTPTIGMLGVLQDAKNLMTLDFKEEGDYIYLIGESRNDIASSQYLASYHQVKASPAPYFDLDEEYATHQVIKHLIRDQLIASAHDVADGGLYIALAESAMAGNLGFAIDTDSEIRKDAFLFGEAQGRVVVSVTPEDQETFVTFMAASGVEFSLLGAVTKNGFVVDGDLYDTVSHAREVYDNVLHGILGA